MSDTFCVLPWIHLATHPNGGASLCCRSNHTDAISWAKKIDSNNLVLLDNDSLDDIINSDKFVQVRQNMLDGLKPVECEGCWKDEDNGIKSKRQYENERWGHIVNKLEKKAYIKRPNYRYIELRLGNLCNNACVTCNSYSSSKWYSDEKKIAKDLSWFTLRPLENFKWFENDNFYNELTNYSRDVEEIYINGGEPTLIKAHFKYLESLIENETCTKVHLVYSLNMMDVPDNLIELWKFFKKVTVNASIDDYDKRNYYIRYPTRWEDTILSISKLSKLTNLNWHVTQTVSILNILSLDLLQNWLEKNFNKTPHHNYVLYPDYLSLAALPNSYKEKILKHYIGKLHDWQYTELKSKLLIDHKPELQVRASQFINSLDKARNLSYKDFIPELLEIL